MKPIALQGVLYLKLVNEKEALIIADKNNKDSIEDLGKDLPGKLKN